MKASLLLTVLLCLNSQTLLAQDTSTVVIQEQPAAAPQLAMPAPIEVEVPVYQPREKLVVPQQPIKAEMQNVYTQIKDSQFFLEINPLRFSASSLEFESNNQDTFGRPDGELELNTSQFKMLPLDFKFGFNNNSWGSFAEILIDGEVNSSELTMYARLPSVRLGAGLKLDINSGEAKLKSNGTIVGEGEVKSKEIAPYFYMAFDLVDSDLLAIEQWNKVGGAYEESEVNDYKISGVSFILRPSLDIMFKINPKLQFGTGIEFEYRRFSGKYEHNGVSYKGIADYFEGEFNFIKTKFLF